MNKTEALQKFASHVDVPALKVDFPDLDYVVTELEDGQQEIIVRLQGEDSDFHPAVDIAAIEALKMEDIPDAVKNTITLSKRKRKLRHDRLRLRDVALLKRIKQMSLDMGVEPKTLPRLIQGYLSAVSMEDITP